MFLTSFDHFNKLCRNGVCFRNFGARDQPQRSTCQLCQYLDQRGVGSAPWSFGQLWNLSETGVQTLFVFNWLPNCHVTSWYIIFSSDLNMFWQSQKNCRNKQKSHILLTGWIWSNLVSSLQASLFPPRQDLKWIEWMLNIWVGKGKSIVSKCKRPRPLFLNKN